MERELGFGGGFMSSFDPFEFFGCFFRHGLHRVVLLSLREYTSRLD
jgi:hypothetical protein